VGERLSKELLRDDFRFDLVYTREPGEAQMIASTASSDVIVAVGGDGTVNEVVNGIGDSRKTLAIIPAGSGNDVIKSLGIPRRIKEALEVLRSGVVRLVDTAVIECSLGDGKGHTDLRRLFLNGAGMGFDASVARRVASIRRLRGTLLYLTAVFQTLKEYSSPDVSIRIDGVTQLGGNKLLVAVGNGVCAGGGFYLTPKASMHDGALDLCCIPALKVGRILGIIPRVLRGTHTTLPGVDYFQGKTFVVSSSAGFAIHADGEIIADVSHEVSFQVRPSSLGVLVPGWST
jgi:YegS/Rv2252/BmrU family lipid kinase